MKKLVSLAATDTEKDKRVALQQIEDAINKIWDKLVALEKRIENL